VRFLLDTDHITFLQRPTSAEYATLTLRMAQYSPGDFTFCIVSLHEQFLGVHSYLNQARSASERLRGYALLETVFRSFAGAAALLPYDAAASAVYDSLIAQRIRIPMFDLRIAATALSRGLVILSRNSRDFTKVPGLTTQDWTV
jgi:tRNA(fMet)-specific endonuclease VapC